jgi:hypothetical protein
MTPPSLNALLQFAGVQPSLFPVNSRYRGIDTGKLETPGGRVVVYLRRRFVPSPESLASVQQHVVAQSDRLDNLAARYFGDPELFWRMCDANAAMRPDDLTETLGRVLRVTMAQGIPGQNL